MSESQVKETDGERRNREWRERSHLVLDSTISDAFSRASYNGVVSVQVTFKCGHIIGIDSIHHQKIRK